MGVKMGNNTAEKMWRMFSVIFQDPALFNRVALVHIKLISNMYLISIMSLLTAKAAN